MCAPGPAPVPIGMNAVAEVDEGAAVLPASCPAPVGAVAAAPESVETPPEGSVTRIGLVFVLVRLKIVSCGEFGAMTVTDCKGVSM
jgi:hypothetical protein